MVFTSDPRVASAMQTAYLGSALDLVRKAIPLEHDDARRTRLTTAAAVIAEVEHEAAQRFADHSRRQADLAAAALES